MHLEPKGTISVHQMGHILSLCVFTLSRHCPVSLCCRDVPQLLFQVYSEHTVCPPEALTRTSANHQPLHQLWWLHRLIAVRSYRTEQIQVFCSQNELQTNVKFTYYIWMKWGCFIFMPLVFPPIVLTFLKLLININMMITSPIMFKKTETRGSK